MRAHSIAETKQPTVFATTAEPDDQLVSSSSPNGQEGRFVGAECCG